MKSIVLIRPKAYVIITCAVCGTARDYRAQDSNGKATDCSLIVARKWAAEDGYTKNEKGQYVCRICAARKAASNA